MENKEEMLKKLGLKTMFNITDAEMPELVEEYEIFMNHVAVLEKIDTDGKAPLAYPYEIETAPDCYFLMRPKLDHHQKGLLDYI